MKIPVFICTGFFGQWKNDACKGHLDGAGLDRTRSHTSVAL